MAGIIKQDQTQQLNSDSRAIAFNLQDWSQRRDEYLEQVKLEAQKIVDQARETASQIHDQAAQSGRTQARQDATQQAIAHLESQLATTMPAIEELAATLQSIRTSWLQEWESRLLQTSLAIAGKLTRDQLQTSPDISLSWIREALEMAMGSGAVLLRLNPADRAVLEPAIDQIVNAMHGLGDVQITEDDSVSQGGCVVQTEFGSIDQQLETQLARLADELGHA